MPASPPPKLPSLGCPHKTIAGNKCRGQTPVTEQSCSACGKRFPWNPGHLQLVLWYSNRDRRRLNRWRKFWPEGVLNLQCVDLRNANLSSAPLEGANLVEARLGRTRLVGTYLKDAKLKGANLKEANLSFAHLEGTDLNYAHLEGADLNNAELEGACLVAAHLEDADLWYANLGGAKLSFANLEGANLLAARLERTTLVGAYLARVNLRFAHLVGANLELAHLEGAILKSVCLERASFRYVTIDAKTIFSSYNYDEKTDFTGAPLDAARIEPKLKTALEYNIRRRHWEEEIPALKIGTENPLFSAYLWKRLGLLLSLMPLGFLLSLMTLIMFVSSILLVVAALPMICFAGLLIRIEQVPTSKQRPFVRLRDRKRKKYWINVKNWFVESYKNVADIGFPPDYQILKKYFYETIKSWFPKGWYPLRNELVGFILLTSDYGKSTRRILWSFVFSSLVFAAIYALPASWGFDMLEGLRSMPDKEMVIIGDRIVTEEIERPLPHEYLAWRALYFSVVTMTTLGFGDVTPITNSSYWWAPVLGYVYVMTQVVIGYLLLGSLITRLGILFQANSSE